MKEIKINEIKDKYPHLIDYLNAYEVDLKFGNKIFREFIDMINKKIFRRFDLDKNKY